LCFSFSIFRHCPSRGIPPPSALLRKEKKTPRYKHKLSCARTKRTERNGDDSGLGHLWIQSKPPRHRTTTTTVLRNASPPLSRLASHFYLFLPPPPPLVFFRLSCAHLCLIPSFPHQTRRSHSPQPSKLRLQGPFLDTCAIRLVHTFQNF
jgi:hypothetical protein